VGDKVKVKVDAAGLTNPIWSVAKAAPGDEVELSVTTKPLTAGQSVEIQISNDDALIAALTKLTVAGTKRTAKWLVPSFPGSARLTFTAVLREAPTPANGHVTSRGRVRSGTLVVPGFKVSIASMDAAFAPGVETLRLKIQLENPGGYNVEGAIMIWGERYPGDAALYSEKITTNTVSGELDWNFWDGKANAGLLAGKLISPEFSPYRVQVMLWPVGKLSAVCTAERGFEVAIESVELRIQEGLPQAVKDTLDTFLGVGTRTTQGTYPSTGRLPLPGEEARMRIPCAGHSPNGDPLGQGGDLVESPYFADKSTPRWKRDLAGMSRPELPLEIEPRLRSRDPAIHPSGRFAKEAVGPLRIEVFADDPYVDPPLFAASTLRHVYLKNALHKVKLGTDTSPVHKGTAAVIGFWQARHVISTAGNGAVDLATLDADFVYAMGKKELTVYLGRAKLQVGAAGSGADCEEISPTHLQIRSALATSNAVVWIVRSDATTIGDPTYSDLAGWRNFPPGANCHVHYGGVRGTAPWDLFRKDFSKTAHRAIIGSGAPFPYTASINLDPDGVGAASERVETNALGSGDHQGLAGVLFSPSFIAGDSYVLGAATATVPYARTLGYLSDRPRMMARTGPLTVWRVMTLETSLRAADPGTNGYPANVGSLPEAATFAASTVYYGNGINMNFEVINKEMANFFNEWEVARPLGWGGNVPVHRDITTAEYIKAHDAAVAGVDGGVPIRVAANITNFFVQFDHFRAKLPPGIPEKAAAGIATRVAALPANTTSVQAMTAAAAALGTHSDDDPSIPVFDGDGGAAAYAGWIDGTTLSITKKILEALTPSRERPLVMNVVRWPEYFPAALWVNGAPIGGTYVNADPGSIRWLQWNGWSLGGGQSFFINGRLDPGVFPHEMAHTLQLAHFTAGDFNWKHHHLPWPDCLMSYGHTRGYIPRPIGAVGPVGAGTTVETGWPDVVPAVMPPNARQPSNPPAAPGSPTIAITVFPTAAHPQLTGKGELCGKCGLKLRGWKEEALPVAWPHPDLF
jgi:hypothetical protein